MDRRDARSRDLGSRHILVVLLACIALATRTGGQQPAPQNEPTPTFRSSIEAVQIDVFVTDAEGNPVSGLTLDDFELFENGKPQPITTFEAVHIPIERQDAAERPLVEPDVLTNDGPPGRVYLFALDEVGGHVSDPGRGANILRTRRLVRQFIEQHFGPNDVGAVAMLGRGLAADGQDFTSNRRLLLEAVDKFSGGFPGPGGGPIGGGCQDYDRLPWGATGVQAGQDRLPIQQLGRGQQMASLRSLAQAMSRIPGRHKAMVIFTECLDIDVRDIMDYRGGVLSIRGEDAQSAMAAATRSNLAIYPIDPTGLSPDRVPLETIGAFRSLGEATGGFALVNSNSFTEAFERIVRESSTYYMLAFNSAYEKNDGRYVRVDVKVRRPELTVHARDGYVAPTRQVRQAEENARRKSAASAVSAALANPLATTGIPMRVVAAPFRGQGRDATVSVVTDIDAAALGLREKDGTLTGDVTVRYIATDAKRKVYPEVAHNAIVTVTSTGERPLPREGLRVRVLSELELRPGRYQVRVAAGTTVVSGSVVYDLQIPDFGDEPITMSGLVLIPDPERGIVTLLASGGKGGKGVKCYSELCAPSPGGTSPTALAMATATDILLQGRLPGAPTTRREFSANDAVVLAAEVYDNRRPGRRDAASMITLAADLRAADGTVIPLASAERVRSASGNGAHAFALRLPLSNVPAGGYVLRVSARSSAAADHAVTREIPLRIR